jgi:hypothetical protein
MDSIDASVDLELLAAFIDGRLSGEERARAVKMLADSDEALELFASTLREQRTSPPTVVQVVPITTARRWRQWKVMLPVAAAAVLAIVMVPKLIGPGGQPGLANQYAMELLRDPRFAEGLRAGWEERGWSVTRGGGLSREAPGMPRAGSATESRLAFRLGVRSIDLQIALRRGDTALAARLTSEVLETLNGVGFSDLVRARYTELKSALAADALPRSIERASDAEREMLDLLGSASFAFGQWVRAAELAAQTHAASFFESSHGTRFIRSTLPADSLSADDTEALQSIDARVKAGTDDRTMDDVRAILQTVIRRRAG